MDNQQALVNATQSESTANYQAIFTGLKSIGIAETDIKPRENVFTYRAWLALGRQVSKGQHGVKVVTYVPMSKTDKETGEKSEFRRPKTTTVFHISQTQEIDGATPQKPDNVTPIIPKPTHSGDKFRVLADKMQKQIDNKLADLATNTPKRLAQANSSRLDGEQLQRTQGALYALAKLHEAGQVPPVLVNIRTKQAVFDLMSTKKEMVPNGYHTYNYCTGKPRHDTPEAVALWALVGAKSEADKEADELRRKIEGLQFSSIPGYFPTPQSVINLMLDYADVQDWHSVLEPSAGSGAIADAVTKAAQVTLQCCERNYTLCEILTAKKYSVHDGDFLEYQSPDLFDRIVMNPPFEKQQDIEHTLHAFKMLKAGGRLVSILSAGVSFRSDKKTTAFNEWINEHGGELHELPADSFKESGTGVNTVMLIIDK